MPSARHTIEVTATFGGSMLGVRHCVDPRGGRSSRATKLLFAVAAACFAASVFAFVAGIDNANDNARRYYRERFVLHRPAYAVRLQSLPASYDWLAFGGLAVAITLGAAALLRMRGEKQPASVRIGSAPGVDFATEHVRDLAIVAPAGDGFAFHFDRGMVGELVVDGERRALAELPRTSLCPIPPNAKIHVQLGQLGLFIASVPSPRRQAVSLFPALDRRIVPYFASSLAIHLGIWLLLQQVPVDGDVATFVLGSYLAVGTRTENGSSDDAAPETSDESGVAGTTLQLRDREEGARGSAIEDTRAREQATELTREEAIEAARHASILGAGDQMSETFARLASTESLAGGFGDTQIYGGLIGGEASDMQGGFGIGLRGVGPGGGGTGWGTIASGKYGTGGYGRGLGEGYGVAGGTCTPLCRGRSIAVPTVGIGQSLKIGDLDKAIIRRYIKRNFDKITYCYERALLAKPDLAGTIRVQFFIAPTGHVATADASGPDQDVAACIADVIKAIEFPRPTGGGGVQVNYPFNVRPAGG